MKKHHEVIANAHSKTKIMKNSSEKIIDKTCLKIESSTEECQERRKMIASTRGSLHVTDDKTQCIICRSTHGEGTG